jgi:hypothetical protein
MAAFAQRLWAAAWHGRRRNRRRTGPARRTRVGLESLEARLTPSWTSTPPSSITVPGSYVSVSLDDYGDASGFGSIDFNENDFYSFVAPTTGNYRFSTSNSRVDTVLGIYSSSGARIAYNDDFNGTLLSSVTTSLNSGQRCYFGITNYSGTRGGSYNWAVDGPVPPLPADDSHENNDSFGAASNLGTLTTTTTLQNLVLNDEDWYRFTISGTGGSSNSITVSFLHSRGDVDVVLYNSVNSRLSYSAGTTDTETLSLNGLSPGTYYLQVYGFLGVRNPNYGITLNVPVAAASDDTYETNDTYGQAYDLGTVTGVRTISNLVMADSGDWFRFTTAGGSTSGHSVAISSTLSEGDLDLRLYSASGGFITGSGSGSNTESISLNGMGAGTYFVEVFGWGGSRNSDYTLTMTTPSSSPDDAYENNDSLFSAADLGSVAGTRVINGLRMADADDYFRFTIGATGSSGHSVSIASSTGGANLDFYLYNISGSQVGTAASSGNGESVSLGGLAAGAYVARVFDRNSTNLATYTLTITAPTSAPATTTRSTLYLNFDGATLSRSDLVRWAGSDWSGMVNVLDPDRNGIVVQRFLASNPNRDAIIARMMQLLQADLSPFGIRVQRTTGLAVENQGATTIFLGRASLADGLAHVACDVDYGNNNRTDIAFVSDENHGTPERTALALADVTLHEAGHTYGLYHVNSGNALESMGLRYSTARSQWVQDTSFMNASFPEFGNHGGGRGAQNTYSRMYNTFVSTFRNPEAEPEDESELFKLEDFPAINLDDLPENRTEIAYAFIGSSEFLSSIIENVYQTYLGRSSDAWGLGNWLQALRSRSVSREQMESLFIASAEYRGRYSTTTDWLQSIYGALLLRSASQPEIDTWLAAINAGMNAATVADVFTTSQERITRDVQGLYRGYLGRDGSEAELLTWYQAYRSGWMSQDIVATFVGSEEYFFNESQGKGQHASWTSQLYYNILNRTASDAEIAGWVSYIRS